MTTQDRITELEAENAGLRAQVGELATLATLRAQVQALLSAQVQALLSAQVQALQRHLSLDSHNSGKPPSSDGLARKTRSLRRPSGKRPGGQLGHRGETLRLVGPDQVDTVVAHRPTTCATCQAWLDAQALVTGCERRQVHDLPPTRLHITQHQALQARCPSCQQVTTAAFPADTPSRAQDGRRLRAWAVYLVTQQCVPYARVRDLLAEGYGSHLSVGTLVTWIQQSAQALAPVEMAPKQAVRQAPVLQSDEHPRLTHSAIHAKRGTQATDASGILPGYTGVSVHDGWKPYQTYTSCRHALCNVHHLRELTLLEEHEQQPWATTRKAVLGEMRTAVAHARAGGQANLPAAQRAALLARYEQALGVGRAANPPPVRRRRQRGRLKQSPEQSPARNLLERLSLGQPQVLAFRDDFAIPFDNNQAERDLRMLKAQQKVSGSFRSDAGRRGRLRVPAWLRLHAPQARCGAAHGARNAVHGPSTLPCLRLNSYRRACAGRSRQRHTR